MTVAQAIEAAVVHQRADRLAEAEALYRRVLEREPQHSVALHNLGLILGQQGRSQEAADCLRQVVALDPQRSDAHYNLAVVLGDLGRSEETIAAFKRAIELKPDYPQALNNLGMALAAEDRLEEAVACYRRALQCRPDYAKAHNSLGNALSRLGQAREAVTCYERAIALEPDYALAHFDLGVELLRLGDFPRGWAEYDWRWRREDMPAARLPSPEKLWDGSPLAGRTLLLRAEQGFGDMLQFIRYAPLVAKRGGKVLLECKPELAPLLQNVPGISGMVSRGAATDFDVHLPLMSLPRIFGTTIETIPADVPYLRPDPARLERWHRRFDSVAFRVGLAWAGAAGHVNDRNRSLPLQSFAPLAEVKGVVFYSLQKGPAAAQAAQMRMEDLSAELNDFADTAAVIAQLDLVITVDTAVAHLAGALARPVWTLLPAVADWRWLTARDDSPWYPTMRLFRQPTRGDWAGVLQRVAGELAQLRPYTLHAGF